MLADGPCTDQGELALGRNILVAFMPWEGYNYEDAIVLSERLVRDDVFTSIHIEKYEIEARDTKVGPEEITRDIPNVGDEALKDLDEDGVIRVGAEVRAEDILVGKVAPKGQEELTAEEKLVRAIFGKKAEEMRDASLRVPHGEKGRVVDVKRFSRLKYRCQKCDAEYQVGKNQHRHYCDRCGGELKREPGDELLPGVNQLVRVYVAQKRKIMEGDKLAGRHGNKGVVSKILPDGGHAVPAGRHPGGHRAQPAGRAVPYEHRADPGDPPGPGGGRSWASSFENPIFEGATDKEILELLQGRRRSGSASASLQQVRASRTLRLDGESTGGAPSWIRRRGLRGAAALRSPAGSPRATRRSWRQRPIGWRWTRRSGQQIARRRGPGEATWSSSIRQAGRRGDRLRPGHGQVLALRRPHRRARSTSRSRWARSTS